MKRYNIKVLRNRKALKMTIILLLIALAMFFIFSFANYKIEPTVTAVAMLKAESLAYKTIDECISESLKDGGISYSSLVYQNIDYNGKIISVELNPAAVNKIKSELSININKKLSEKSIEYIDIPLGSFSGIDFLSDAGPNINVSVNMTGNAQVSLKDSFIDTGINQTQHRIILETTVKIYIFAVGSKEYTQIKSDYIIAETIIIGDVPQSSSSLKIPQK